MFSLERKRLLLCVFTADCGFVKMTIVEVCDATNLRFEITVLEFLVATAFARVKARVITHYASCICMHHQVNQVCHKFLKFYRKLSYFRFKRMYFMVNSKKFIMILLSDSL